MKIIFSGPECSGKSTLSNWTANKLNGHLCLEYAREHLSVKNKSYSLKDIEIIGRKQKKKWQENTHKSTLVMDTDFLVLKIWSKWKFNTCCEFIEQEWLNQQFDFYFLCKPDIPWEFDKLRESKDERNKLFKLYVSELNKKNINYIVLEGTVEKRQEKILDVINHKVLSH